MTRPTILLLVAALAPYFGCSSGDLPADPPPPPPDRAEWMTDDPADWPSITTINRITYTDGEHPSAACGFLIDTGDEIVAATAKHVLTYFKSEAMDSVSFRGTLLRWEMVPKDRPDDVVILGELINENPDKPLNPIPSTEDWVLMTVDHEGAGLPVQPLRLRETALVTGETVYVVGWRYPDLGPQRVHPGRFVRMHEGAVIIDVEAIAGNKIPGLSGSPVIDAGGKAIGLMSTGFGDQQRLAPAGYALDRLREWTGEPPGVE